jgi:hypothetical protein
MSAVGLYAYTSLQPRTCRVARMCVLAYTFALSKNHLLLDRREICSEIGLSSVVDTVPIRLDDQLPADKPYTRLLPGSLAPWLPASLPLCPPLLPLRTEVSRKSCLVIPRFTFLRSIKHTSIPSILGGTTSSAETILLIHLARSDAWSAPTGQRVRCRP